MKSIQTVLKLAAVRSNVRSFRFSSKNSSKDYKLENEEHYDIVELLSEVSDDNKHKIVMHFHDAQEQIRSTHEKLEDASKQVKNLDHIIHDQNKKLKELRENLKAQIEDVELTRKRLEKEKDQLKVFAISNFAKELLEVQDNLERALEINKNEFEGKNNSLYEGVQMTYKIFDKILKKNGVQQIDCLNKKYDPNTAEALVQVDDPDKEAGTVVFVAQQGYMIGQRVLRPAKVGIVRNKD